MTPYCNWHKNFQNFNFFKFQYFFLFIAKILQTESKFPIQSFKVPIIYKISGLSHNRAILLFYKPNKISNFETISGSTINTKKELQYLTRVHFLNLIICQQITNEFCFFVKATLCITTALTHHTAIHLFRTRFVGRAVAFYYVENFRCSRSYTIRYTNLTNDLVDFITYPSTKCRVKLGGC